ncbi:methyl-accepting chemotaxis protein [Oleisolibacter albus]|uniref:methyl-accepting chemotaxis protein n=1 Tax=Oleisolibacter albus TaxID=2171757 RepID=UPI000DF2E3F8|nr:methyl-accepting chemotaxis protein [Oleisolibacter albus]
MAHLSDLPIRIRIFLAFGLVMLVTLGLGAFALWQLRTINDAADRVVLRSLPSVITSNLMLEDVLDFRRNQAATLLATDPATRAERHAAMAALVPHIAEQRRAYEALITTERPLIEQFDQAWAQVLATATVIDDRLGAGDQAGAMALYNGASRSATDAAVGALKQVVHASDESGQAAGVVIEETTHHARIGTLLALVIAAGLSIGAGAILVITIAVPTRHLTEIMRRLSRRELTTVVEGTARRDEIGAMARAVEQFKLGLIEVERLSAIQAAAEQAKAERAARIDQLIAVFDGAVSGTLHSFANAAAELDATARSLSAIAEETSRQATAASGAAEQTTANVQTIAGATEELAVSVGEISREVARAKDTARRASDNGRQTNIIVGGLTEAVGRIGEIMDLIQAIASQTNLLALNATIEAARAGEAGKGFAVVASEVKTLATQTARATDEIGTHVATVQKVSADTSESIGIVIGTIAEVDQISASIAASIEQQGAATGEISRNIAQVATGIGEMSGNVDQVKDATAHAGVAAGQVLSAANELSQQSEVLKRDVERFLLAIRAA